VDFIQLSVDPFLTSSHLQLSTAHWVTPGLSEWLLRLLGPLICHLWSDFITGIRDFVTVSPVTYKFLSSFKDILFDAPALNNKYNVDTSADGQIMQGVYNSRGRRLWNSGGESSFVVAICMSSD